MDRNIVPDEAMEENVKYDKANPYLAYLQMTNPEKMNIFTALLSDTVNYGLFNRVFLDFCIYGPWHNKHGEVNPEDISKLWDQEHEKFPNSVNIDSVKDNFMELVDEYATRIIRARTKYMNTKQAQSEGGRKSQRNRQHKSAAGQDPEEDDESEVPDDVPKLPVYQSMYKQFARDGGLTLDQAMEFIHDISEKGESSSFFTEQLPGVKRSEIAILDHAKLSPPKEEIKKFLNTIHKCINGVTVVSQLEQKWALLFILCSLDWKRAFINKFKEYNGFRLENGNSALMWIIAHAKSPDEFCEFADHHLSWDPEKKIVRRTML